MKRTYIVEKMMCAGCVRAIDTQLAKVDSIAYNVNLPTKTVEVDFFGEVDDHKVIKAIKAAGYNAMRL